MVQCSFGLIALQQLACQYSLSLLGSELHLFRPSTVELERTPLAKVCLHVLETRMTIETNE